MRRLICQGQPIERLLYHKDGQVYQSEEAIPFYAGQMRLVLKNCGHIDAENIEEYIAVGGYSALEKVLFDIDKDTALDMMEESGLRGRGGGGFPAGRKWKQVARQKETQRYVVCNGDEGDPGAFMDRSIMEGDPHKMLGGYADRFLPDRCTECIYLCARRVSSGSRASAESRSHRQRSAV